MNEKVEEILNLLSEIQMVMSEDSDESFHVALIFAQQLEEELTSLMSS